MAYRIEVRPSALRELKSLPKDDRERIDDCIRALATDPRPHGVETLSGPDRLLRVRVGVYRIIYQVHDNVLLVVIVRVRHRKDVYRRL